MKNILSLTGILALAILFTSAISIGETPQDPPRGKKEKKHIKMVKVGDDGKKMEIDTIIEATQVFVWNGDTIGDGKELKWIGEGDFDLDMDFDINVEEDGDGNVFILKGKGKNEPLIYKFKTEEGDSLKEIRIKVIADGDNEDIMQWHSKGGNDMFFAAPQGAEPRVVRIDKNKGNVIDLSDPGIISYEKKDLKDGKEKIVIVREKPAKQDVELHEEFIIQGAKGAPMMIHEGMPQKAKQIKVIAGDDGQIEIIEDSKVWSVEESGDETKVIEKDGKMIIIKKQKQGGEMKVDVEVEEKIKEEK